MRLTEDGGTCSYLACGQELRWRFKAKYRQFSLGPPSGPGQKVRAIAGKDFFSLNGTCKRTAQYTLGMATKHAHKKC